MAIGIIVPDRNIDELVKTIKQQLPKENLFVYPELPADAPIDFAVLWSHPQNIWEKLPGVKVLCSLGAGIDHLIFDDQLPADVRITRIVDDNLVVGMRRYVTMAVLNIHKNFLYYQRQQAAGIWDSSKKRDIPLKIGVLGMGQLGADVARHLSILGFTTLGFSNTPKLVDGVTCMNAQEHSINDFLGKINLLVNLLPLTRQTSGWLDADFFGQLPQGAYFINVGRGAHVNERDLIHALDSGQLKMAILDVFDKEPLPENHPLWNRKDVIITPHVASLTAQREAALQIVENYKRYKNGEPLYLEVNTRKEY